MKKKIYESLVMAVKKDMDDVLTGSFETPDDTFPIGEYEGASYTSRRLVLDAYDV